jgi:hypothetical protein
MRDAGVSGKLLSVADKSEDLKFVSLPFPFKIIHPRKCTPRPIEAIPKIPFVRQ